MIGQPVASVGSGQVQERAAEQPLGMVLGQPRALGHAFRLEPDQGLDSPGVRAWSLIARSPRGKPREVGLPGAGLGPLAAAGIPAGVHPPVVDRHALLEIAIDEDASGSPRWRCTSR